MGWMSLAMRPPKTRHKSRFRAVATTVSSFMDEASTERAHISIPFKEAIRRVGKIRGSVADKAREYIVRRPVSEDDFWTPTSFKFETTLTQLGKDLVYSIGGEKTVDPYESAD